MPEISQAWQQLHFRLHNQPLWTGMPSKSSKGVTSEKMIRAISARGATMCMTSMKRRSVTGQALVKAGQLHKSIQAWKMQVRACTGHLIHYTWGQHSQCHEASKQISIIICIWPPPRNMCTSFEEDKQYMKWLARSDLWADGFMVLFWMTQGLNG